MNFLGLSEKDSAYETSPVVVIPCPFEKTTSYMKGTGNGPEAILEASQQVEFYDAELKREVWKPGIHTFFPLPLSKLSSEEGVLRIEKEVGKVLADRKFPICLGGEHTLSAGAIAAAARRYPELSVLQIDAHADLRESYEGTPYSHACAMRLAFRHAKKIVGVGIRSVETQELLFAKEHPGIKLMWDHERVRQSDWMQQAMQGLSEDVYLTIDVDGFDPSLIGATGTPEPGGLSWYEGLALLRTCFQEKNVVAADLVELLPQPGFHASAFAAAKLVYKLAAYWRETHP